MKKRLRIAFASIVLCAFTACQGTAPPTPVPPAPTPSGYASLPPQTSSTNVAGGAAQRFHLGTDVPGEWWTLFHSAQLNALIDQALAANPDIGAAQAALRSAREAYLAQRASAYPNAQASFSISRQQVPTYYAPPINNQPAEYVYGVHTASVDVAYTPDVFGNLRYQTASAAAAAQVQRFQVEETYLTLTANVVATAILIAQTKAQIEATKRVIDVNQRLLDVTVAQRRYGQLTELDVATQEAALRGAEQTLPPLQKQLAQNRDLLARLLGETSSAQPDASFALTDLHLPEDLPLSVPSQLIAQRPDIASANANLAQASADVGVAHTNRLPNFSITSQTATQALSLAGMFGPGTLLSMLTGEVAATIYDHGTLKHREAAAVAAYDQAAYQYTGAILTGIQGVADALAALETDADTLRAANLAERAAARALDIVRSQQRYGQVSTPAILNAEQAYQQAVLSLVQAQGSRYSDTSALFAALGGGWWNRHETSAQ